ncbi:calcium-binding protein P [Lepisosteus oculatus]|uniref:Prion protein, related sequence 3 n=1 Tax=Lepisosteus oculatus TaxID=7918 RepID=W5NN77_LEPOC|nr:PREDICTED: spidroin-2 [Lepisosteus oculatus]
MLRPAVRLSLLALLLLLGLHCDPAWGKGRGGGSRGGGSKSSGSKGSSWNFGKSKTGQTGSTGQTRNTGTAAGKPNPGSYPKQQYPAGGYPQQYPNQNPGGAGANPGGYPNQYPAGGYPNQNPGRAGANPGGYPNQYPAGGYPNQYPNQNPGRAGANPGGYPNQYPAGGYPNQYPGGYPNQYPARGGVNPGGYPNQYPAAGGYPHAYPGGAGYPGGGQGWGQPAGYPNWNPNNKFPSPRFGGYGHGAGGYGAGGSPFSRTAQDMGYGPSHKSKGFGKKAAMAAGVGAVAGMAVGYGLGRFPRPNFNFHSPEEAHYYNHYMWRRYGSRSTDENDYGRDYQYNPPPQGYDSFMDNCIKRPDLLPQPEATPPPASDGPAPGHTPGNAPGNPGAEPNGTLPSQVNNSTANGTQAVSDAGLAMPSPQGTGPDGEGPGIPSPSLGEQEQDDNDTVSIMEIGYPELIEQLKVRRCVEMYITYSDSYLQKQTDTRGAPNPKGAGTQQLPLCQGLVLLVTTSLTLLTSTLLLQ